MNAEVDYFQFDSIEVRPASLEVLRAGNVLPLEPKAIRLLLFLIENRHRAVSKDEIIAAVWAGAAVTDNALTRVVAQLRRELGDDARQPRYIQTLPTHGYRFVAELTSGAPLPARRRHRPLATIAALGILAALALYWNLFGTFLFRQQARPVQLTTSPALDTGARYSRDGKAIIYSSSRTGWFQIYSRPVAPAGRERQITDSHDQPIEPCWSPDGRLIVYHPATQGGIWVMSASGEAPRQISSFGSSPAWSPDGRLIAFRSVEPYSFALFDLPGLGESTIWTVAPDGSGLRKLTLPGKPAGRHASPSWSPDSKRIVFSSMWNAQGLWTVDVATGEPESIPVRGVAFQANPVFSPDGKTVYFGAYAKELSFSVYSLALGGIGVPSEVLPLEQNVAPEIAISPDGRQLALYARH